MLTPKYEVDMTTQYGVMAHFSRAHYDLDHFPISTKNWMTWTSCWRYVPILKFVDLCIIEIRGHKTQICWHHC